MIFINHFLFYRFSFVKINKINELPLGSTIDVIGIIKDSGSYMEILIKSSQTMKGRRTIQIFDDSLSGIELTLWGDLAQKELPKNSIILLTNVKTNEYNGSRNLTSSFQTSIFKDETLEEYKKLDEWRNLISGEELEGINIASQSEKKIYRSKTLIQIETEAGHMNEDKIFTDTKACILQIKNDERTPLYYLACPNEKCSKKVVEENSGEWKCESCNKSYKDVNL